MAWNANFDSSHRSQRPSAAAPRVSRRPKGSLRPKSATSHGLGAAAPAASSSPGGSSGPRPESPARIDEESWFGSRDIAGEEDAAARSMAALVGRIVGAKPFPESARRLADLTRADVVRIEPVIQVLERDPALSARLLRLVNSAGYALRQRCTSVRHAATLVGTDRLHQIATTAAVLDMFDARGSVATQIVEHSTLVGAFCRYLGAHLALPVDDLFTAGFLHDIGKLMLLETEGDGYVELLEQTHGQPDTLYLLEREAFGFDHAMLAAHVLSAWYIPDPVPKIVAWHHDPARAFHTSSLMAALVQTVRLADAAVYVMERSTDAETLGKLASLESASFLDISEAQLATMWDELRVLYDQSVAQCREKNAPALDPRSLRPKNPLSIASGPRGDQPVELPLQFPCVVCAHPTFGNTCPACGGHVCPDHQVGREGWCSLCAQDYRQQADSTPVPGSVRYALGLALLAVLTSGTIGMFTAGRTAALRAGFGTLLLIALIGLLSMVGRRLILRFRFSRNRPNRVSRAPRSNDGGVLSLVPPGVVAIDPRICTSSERPPEELDIMPIGEPPRVSPSCPSMPAVGVHDSWICASERPMVSDAAVEPEPDIRAPVSIRPSSSSRIALQGKSLVTLPAPARNTDGGEESPEEAAELQSRASAAEERPSRKVKRRPRDTLREVVDEAPDAPLNAAVPSAEAVTVPAQPRPAGESVAAAIPQEVPGDEMLGSPLAVASSVSPPTPLVGDDTPNLSSEDHGAALDSAGVSPAETDVALPEPSEPGSSGLPPAGSSDNDSGDLRGRPLAAEAAKSATPEEGAETAPEEGAETAPEEGAETAPEEGAETTADALDVSQEPPPEPDRLREGRRPLVARPRDTMVPQLGGNVPFPQRSPSSPAKSPGLERAQSETIPPSDYLPPRISHAPAVSTHPLAALGLAPPHIEPPAAVFPDVVEQVETNDDSADADDFDERRRLCDVGPSGPPTAPDSEAVAASAVVPSAPPVAPEPEVQPAEVLAERRDDTVEAKVAKSTTRVGSEPGATLPEPEQPAPEVPVLPVASSSDQSEHESPVVEGRPVTAKKRARARRAKAPKAAATPEVPVSTAAGADAIADTMASQLTAQLGPEFQARVLSMVAERVASLVAERMAQSLIGGAMPVSDPERKPKRRGKR